MGSHRRFSFFLERKHGKGILGKSKVGRRRECVLQQFWSWGGRWPYITTSSVKPLPVNPSVRSPEGSMGRKFQGLPCWYWTGQTVVVRYSYT